MKYYLWPSWHGALIRWSAPKKSGLIVGRTSHDTAWQIRINAKYWSWFIVLRDRTRPWWKR